MYCSLLYCFPLDCSLSESTDSRATMYRQAVMFLGLLCMLLVIANILLAVYRNLLQVTNRFQTQNLSLKKNCSQMSKKYKKLNNTYNEMFQKYPVLMKYCPVRDMTSNERDCQPCPERWVSFKEKCYFYSSDRLDWTASEHQCMAQGGHLVIVETEEEQAFLWEKANRRSQGDSYWIGLTGLKGNDGDWLWVDNTPLKN
uniref:C-type lectin domain-containing protein n=1 Tax=Lepisosteus oculatus TaxID=7918 RepID=W5MJ45_LEPOC